MLDRRIQVEQPHFSTCRWILDLEEYIEWTNSPFGLLWIKGKPGAGKSTLMSFLYDELRSQQSPRKTITLDFFYSARGSELQRSPLGMFRSLLNQLFRADESIRPIVIDLYNEKSHSFGQAVGETRGWEWQQRELEMLLSEAIINASQLQEINIFIDALDEAGEVAARQIAQYFHTLNDQVARKYADGYSSAVSTCISCRHYPIASSIPGTELWVEHHNGADIKAFVHDRLNIAARLDDDADLKEWNDLEIEVVQKSQNVFQWARLVVPLLDKCLDEAEPINEIKKLIKELPKELEDVYDYVIRHVISTRYRTQSYRLFRWVCLAERPLSLPEMSCALLFDDKIPQLDTTGSRSKNPTYTETYVQKLQQRIKAFSGGLVEVIYHTEEYTAIAKVGRYNIDQGHVQIIHQSVNEYLMQDGLLLLDLLQRDDNVSEISKTNIDQHLIVSRCQASLYWSCLNYFVSNLTEMKAVLDATLNYLSNETVYGGDSRDHGWNLLRHFPFTHYACYNVLDHAQKAGDDRGIDLKVEITLLKQIIFTWTRVNDLFERSFLDDFPQPETGILHIAATANLLDMLKCAVGEGADVNQVTRTGYTPLHYAARKGFQQVADFLISSGARINAKTRHGHTPFVLAAASDRISLVISLLQKETEINTATENLNHALLMACVSGQNAVVEVLLKAGADVNKPAPWGSTFGSAIHAAMKSREGTLKVVQTLIRAGADVNLGIPRSTTVIEMAKIHAAGEDPELVRLLLDAGGYESYTDDFSQWVIVHGGTEPEISS